MERDGKWRYTSPTHVVLAFAKALRELKEEGGIPARAARYAANQRLLARRMEAMGFKAYLDHHQRPIITTFYYPQDATFSFAEMYDYAKPVMSRTSSSRRAPWVATVAPTPT